MIGMRRSHADRCHTTVHTGPYTAWETAARQHGTTVVTGTFNGVAIFRTARTTSSLRHTCYRAKPLTGTFSIRTAPQAARQRLRFNALLNRAAAGLWRGGRAEN
jgi:hypothetical protein